MKPEDQTTVTVETTVNVPVTKVWDYWTTPRHIGQWNNASDDWHTPHAENDLRVGGKFLFRMEARNGDSGFDFAGVYEAITKNQYIAYRIDDGRKVQVTFTGEGEGTKVTETFETESMHATEMQRGGWQAILDNFKKYTESH
ncbi:MAG TPA: SRPBCC domain-containing protein [Chitinophagaceae bacterium]|nr:SRPBCC domain-containing protein [Chitinophagaceae bacterium]